MYALYSFANILDLLTSIMLFKIKTTLPSSFSHLLGLCSSVVLYALYLSLLISPEFSSCINTNVFFNKFLSYIL